MFDIYNLEKSFTSEYVKGRKKIVNVTINLMDFKEKQNRLEDFEYNVIPCLRNEILSRSIVIHDHESGVDTITDKRQLFNMTCTKIVFKDYLENHNMKVSELQLILNDLYESFSLNKIKTKKSSNKASSRNTTVEDVTEKNISTEVVTNIEKMLVKKTEIEITSTSADKDKSKLSNNENTDQISDTKMSEKEKPNDKLTAGGNVIA